MKVPGPQAAMTHTHNGAVVTSVSIGVWVVWRLEALADLALQRSPRVQPVELRNLLNGSHSERQIGLGTTHGAARGATRASADGAEGRAIRTRPSGRGARRSFACQPRNSPAAFIRLAKDFYQVRFHESGSCGSSFSNPKLGSFFQTSSGPKNG